MKKKQELSRSPLKLVILYFLITIFVMIFGIRYYFIQKTEIRDEKYSELSVISDLKVKQIENWRNERIGDATAVSNSKLFTSELKKWLENPGDTNLKNVITSDLSVFYKYYEYGNILLFDTNFRINLALDKKSDYLGNVISADDRKSFNKKGPELTNIRFDKFDEICLDVIAPMLDGEKFLGGLILRINPSNFLFPMLQTWPTKSESSETLLITKEGEEVVYLNELRHKKNTALKLKFKIDSSNFTIPSVMAVLGKEGLFEGMDYREIRVLSDIRKIKDSPWIMVTKVDLNEIYTPLLEKTISDSIIIGLLLISIGIGFIWVWTNQTKSSKILHLEEENKRQALIKHFEYLIKNANDIVILSDKEKRIIDVNESASNEYGYSREEMLNMNIKELFTPESYTHVEDVANQEEFEKGIIYETIHKRKDNTAFPVEVSAHIIEINEKKYFQRVIRNISERKNSEKLLRESEIKFRSLFENAILGIYRTTPEGKIIDCNPALLKMLGFENFEDLANRNLEIHGFEPGYSRSEFKEKIETEGEIIGLESSWIKKDGTSIYVRENAKAIKDETGKFLFYEGTVEDITLRKEIELELITSEKKYRRLHESMMDGFILVDMEGKLLEFNESYRKMLGYTGEELNKLTYSEITPAKWHDYEKNVVEQILNIGYSDVYEKEYRKKDGTVIPIELRTFLLKNDSGENEGMWAVVRDITERKKAEEEIKNDEKKLSEIIESLPQLFWTCRIDGPCDYLSKQWIEYTGIPEEEQLGYRWLEQLHPEDRDKTVSDWLEKVKNGVGFDISFRIKRKDGKYRWFKTRAVPIRDINDNIIKWFGSNTDVEDIIQSEIKIRKLNEELEQRVIDRTAQLQNLNRELEAFSYSVSHDLRAPLRSIDGFSLAIYEDYYNKLDEKGKEYLERIRNATNRMDELIDSMLKLSRVTRFELKYDKVNLSSIAKEIMDNLINQKSDRIAEINIQENIIAEGDSYLLRILLDNLLVNAWKFTSNKGKSIIEFGTIKKDFNTVFFVKDNGTGFDMKYYDKLFGAFQRLHSQKDFPGTGVGLATAQRIVHRHNGKIWAESEIISGTTFYFTLK